MKPKQTDATSFSMADFEKGLVLAGLLTPRTVQELEEMELLNAYEKQEEKKTDPKKLSVNVYFKRAVLAAEIVSSLHEEPSFGRVKFQKLVYLCEHAAQMNLHDRYQKQVAGPFDNKFMHSIEKEFKQQKWFAVEKITKGLITRSKYIPLDNCDGYKKYYHGYFFQTDNSIKIIIELFRNKKTDFAEISATLFACYLELKEKEIPITEEGLLNRFYAWSPKKNQYARTTVLNNWSWLKDNGVVLL